MQQSSFAEEVAALTDIPLSNVFSIEEQEALYAMGYQCYENGIYTTASQFFTKLILCNPFEEKYWRGLASSQQMLTAYLDALHAWSQCALLAVEDPLPHFHAAECLFSLNEKQDALKALSAAESLLPPDENILKNKIMILKQVHSDG